MNLRWCQELDSPFAKSVLHEYFFFFFFCHFIPLKKVLPKVISVLVFSASTVQTRSYSVWERTGSRGTDAILALDAFLSGSLCASHWIKLNKAVWYLPPLNPKIPPPSIYGNCTMPFVVLLVFFFYIWTANIKKKMHQL